MGSFSIVHVLILLTVAVVWVVPVYHLLGRIGWSRGWTIVSIFPLFALILLWCIAFGRWRSPGNAAS